MITAPSPFPDVEAMEPQRAAVRELAAHIYSAQAELALKVARLDDDGGWAGDGYLSIVHWLSIHLGLGRVSARELVRVGHALAELPKVAEAFASGSLFYDKVRFICQVATPEDQEVWVELAETISGSQLIKICLGYRRAREADSGERAEAQLARRGLWTFREDDGMVRLTALLPAEDAAVVMTAIEAVAAEQPPVPIQDTSPVPDPAEDRWAARRADSLVAICEQAGALAGSPEGLVSDPESCQLVVHVDLGVLTGEEPHGRCHLEDGTPISAAVARRLGCDAQVVAITEREGLPIDVGRSRRLFSKPQRRALQARDGTCRFPGCGVPARRTHLHHLLAWELGGPSDLANAASLCRFHHGRLHEGHYRILGSPDGELRFETRDGRPIMPPPSRIDPSQGGGTAHLRRLAQENGHQIGDGTPWALYGGQPPDYGLAIEMLIHNHNLRPTRAGPSP
ncbi:MAG TPA: DUF222 domain-containing protein [Candidatus Dormibacteraeota bacterium]|nr:DUF222 domain-containing protein [Candidatus Dormibacteraeota bacterium]